MAYTYDDFLNTAKKTGVTQRLTQSDLDIARKNPEYGISLVGLMKDVDSATTTEGRLLATEAANQLRKNYGVYGVGDNATDMTYASSYGSTINDLLEQVGSYGSFDYKNQDAYQKLLDSVANQGSFSYDYREDPSWQAYKKAYLREGDRASANALAQTSAASGGRASSYAQTAAQQAGNYYSGQLADVIPSLEQSAYQKYLEDYSRQLNSLNAMQNDRSFDYGAWQDRYNMLLSGLASYQEQDDTDYQRFLDAYAKQYQEEQQAYENALTLYNILGYATPEVAKILGLPESQASPTSPGNPTTGNFNPGNPGDDPDDGNDLLKGMLEDLQTTAADEGVDTDNFTVTNRNGDGWITVGAGRMTWTELERAVNQGEIVEVIDPDKGTITYKYASSPTAGSTKNDSGKKQNAAGGGGGGKKPIQSTAIGFQERLA